MHKLKNTILLMVFLNGFILNYSLNFFFLMYIIAAKAATAMTQ